jgi:hypothetical protein
MEMPFFGKDQPGVILLHPKTINLLGLLTAILKRVLHVRMSEEEGGREGTMSLLMRASKISGFLDGT